MLVAHCDNHPRRTNVIRFRYWDAHGFHYDIHYCNDCAEAELGAQEPCPWRPAPDWEGYEWRQPLADCTIEGCQVCTRRFREPQPQEEQA